MRAGVRRSKPGVAFIEELLEEEVREALGRERYVRLKTTSGAYVAPAQELGDEAAPAALLAPAIGHRYGRRADDRHALRANRASKLRVSGNTPGQSVSDAAVFSAF